MEDLRLEILEEFKEKTGYPIKVFFEDVEDFISNYYSNIISFYKGESSSLDTQSFEILNDLLKRVNNIFEIIRLNGSRLRNYKFWELESKIEDTYTFLLNIKNSPKWLRSTANGNKFSTNIALDIPLQQGQTLENISEIILGSSDFQNDWKDLAVQNELEEEDYTSDGGIIIKAIFNKGNKSISIKSVVDTMEEENILGKDFKNKLTFEDNDLKILSPKETFLQSINTLINLRKGGNPEFRNQGLNPKFIVGSNINNITYPTLFRDLTNLFRTDDSIKSFSIVDIKREGEAIYISFSVENRLGEIQDAQLIL